VADKKVREREFVDQAAALLGWQTVVKPGERPDFVLEMPDGSIVGLEVGRLADESYASSTPAIQRLRDDLKRRLEAGNHKVHVFLSLFEASPSLISSTRAREKHVNGVMALIKAALPALPLSGGRVRFEEKELKAAGAAQVWRMIVSTGEDVNLTLGRHGSMPAREFLTAQIRRKDDKLPDYRERLPGAAEFWLLLVGNSDVGGPFAGEVASGGEYPTLYERVFYLDVMADTAVQVNTTRAT
jgi:hypothetical protein